MKEFKLVFFIFLVSGLLLFCFGSSVVAATAKPDLKCSSISNVPDNITRGDSFLIADRVVNSGKKSVKSFTVHYYLSLDTKKSNNDILLIGSRNVNSLKSKKYSTGTAELTVPADTPLKSYFLLSCADDKKKIKESNEKNNCRASKSKINVLSGGDDDGVWQIVTEQWDDDNNGTMDWVETYTYDANGNPIKRENDSGNNGTIDHIWTITYDANGNPTKMEQDSGNNGTIDAAWTYTYDANGNLTKREEDKDNNGTIDEVDTYTYDANGNRTKREEDEDNSGSIDRVETYTYDANGKLTKEERDSNNNGTIDSVTTYAYDANGNLTKEEDDWSNNGTINSVTTYTYDANGNLTKREEDEDNSGTIDEVVYYTWAQI